MHVGDLVQRLPAVDAGTAVLALFGCLVLAVLLQALYNLFLHPLRHYPGPLLSRASPLPHALRLVSGTGPIQVHRLHERYGPVVRLAPSHLSYTDLRARKDIYGHRTGSNPQQQQQQQQQQHASLLLENPKSKRLYRDSRVERLPPNIISASRDEHARLRRALAHGFSERAMRDQEPLIRRYVDLLVERLRARAVAARGGGGKAMEDMVRWYNWTTFDVVGDLVFAESFGCLEREDTHLFVELITGVISQGTWMLVLRYLGLLAYRPVGELMKRLVRLFAPDMLTQLNSAMGDKLRRRLEVKEDRSDLFEGLMKRREEWNLDMGRLQSNASLLVAAGSETTASLLSGATYLLLTNPDAMEKLKHEVRSSFGSADEITLISVGRLHYMLACLNEALRRYPPAAGNLGRDVHEGGEFIAGQFVPEKTTVEAQQYAMNHSSQHWRDPYAFKPERFLHKFDSELGEARADSHDAADGDHLEAMQAFSVGPRNCIGRNLAYAEMRLILARIIYDFDMALADESRDWLARLRVYTIWRKAPLYVYLTPVKRE